MSGIKGKVVVITGASGGIGEATAALLAGRGAKLVLGARRSDILEALVDRIVMAGGEAIYTRTDVTRRDDLMSLVKVACARFGKLDVLINNAGIGPISLLDELRVEDETLYYATLRDNFFYHSQDRTAADPPGAAMSSPR